MRIFVFVIMCMCMCMCMYMCVCVPVCVCHCEWFCYRKLTRGSYQTKKSYQCWLPPWDPADLSPHWVSFFTSQGSVLKPSPASEKWLYSTTAPWGSVFPASPGFNTTYTLFALTRANGLSISCRDQRLIVGWRSLHRHFPVSSTIISQNTSACRLVVTPPSWPWPSSLLYFAVPLMREGMSSSTNWNCCTGSCKNRGEIPKPDTWRPKDRVGANPP